MAYAGAMHRFTPWFDSRPGLQQTSGSDPPRFIVRDAGPDFSGSEPDATEPRSAMEASMLVGASGGVGSAVGAV